MLVSQFLLGLKEDLRHVVEMHLPDSVSQAATLASVQEHLTGKSKSVPRKFQADKGDGKSAMNSSELWKARQLKEYRRANNLCFKCRDKYTPTHTCVNLAVAIHLMEHSSADGGAFLFKDILEVLEEPQFHMMQEDCYLSLHALSGKPQHKAIQLRALVQNQVLIILVDSCSSHTFLNSSLAHKLQLTATPLSHMVVEVANGVVLSCTSEVKGFKWWIQGHTFHIDAKVLDMGAYDLVLSMDWLEQFSPMNCAWLEKWIEFRYNNQLIRFQGIVHSEPSELPEVSIEQVLKWGKGNELWAIVLIEPSTKSSPLLDSYIHNGIPD
jgi:hypothetical protein